MLTPLLDRTTRIWTKLFPNPRFYGWAIVGLSFLACALSSPGQSFAISLYIEEVMVSLDASRLQVSSIYGSMTLLAAFFLPLVGNLSDRTTGKVFLTWNLALLALAIAFFGFAQNLLMLAAAFFFLRLLGQGAIGLGTLTETVRWFRRYRGRALAVGGLGYAFGELVFPITIVALIGALGWRGSLWTFAGVYLILFVPLFALLMRPRHPEELLDGNQAPSKHLSSATPDEEEEPSVDLKAALKTPVFWGLLLCVSVLPLVVTAVIFHQIALFDAVGWGAARVPLSFVFFALFGVISAYSAGIILERVPARFGIVVAMLVGVAAMMMAFVGGPSLAGSIAYGILLGTSSGLMSSSNALIWPNYYGVEALGAIKGVVNGVRNGATALGPPLVAILIGPDEHFGVALIVLGAISLLAALAAGWMKPPERK